MEKSIPQKFVRNESTYSGTSEQQTPWDQSIVELRVYVRFSEVVYFRNTSINTISAALSTIIMGSEYPLLGVSVQI